MAQGGTGLGTLTANAVVLGEGTSSPGFATIGTAGRALIDQGAAADPGFKVISGDGTLTAAGALAITKTLGTAFAPSATIDTTNAANITSGILPAARPPNPIGNNPGRRSVDRRHNKQMVKCALHVGCAGSYRASFH